MKLSLTILIVSIHFCFLVSGQAPVFEKQWDKRFGGLDDDIVTALHILPDSGFIVGGSSFSGLSGDKSQPNHDTSNTTSDYWLLRIDSAGTLIWDLRFGGTQSETLTGLILTSDGGFLAGGNSFSGASGDKSEANQDSTGQSNDFWIIKTDNLGNQQWDKRFGGDSHELLGSMVQLPDSGFVLAGSSFSGVSGDKTEPSRGSWDYWLIRTDAQGNKIWDKRFGGTSDEFATTVVLSGDGKIIVGGYSTSGIGGDKTGNGQGGWDYWLVKIDLNGSKLWDRTYGGTDTDWMFALCSTLDGGFLLGGQSFSPAGGDKSEPNHDPTPSGSDRWIIKTDADGIKQWDRSLGGAETEDIKAIVQNQDGGFLLSGESYSDSTGNKTESNLGPEQTWLISIDSVGNVLWDKTLFTYGHDEKGIALPYSPDCFVAVNFTQADTGGYKTQPTQGYGDIWMIKMCEASPLSINYEDVNSGSHWAYPNPFAGSLQISVPYPDESKCLQIYDAAGRLIINMQITPGNDQTLLLNTVEWDAGFYSGKLTAKEKTVNFKVVKTD